MTPSAQLSEPINAPFGATYSQTSRTWTTERVEQLRHCVGAGLTCAQIAREIGVSRNAVIGKLNRLGLSRGRAPAAARPERGDTARMRRPHVLTQRQILRAVYAQAPASAETPTPIVSLARCSLFELAHDKCRWPLSDPGAEDFSFCGNSVVSGLPYCSGHARMAYRVPARR